MDTTTQIEEIANQTGFNVLTLQGWLKTLKIYTDEFFSSNNITPENMTPENVNEAIVYSSQRVKNIYQELLENRTCRARVTRQYMALSVWYKTNHPEMSSTERENKILEDLMETHDLVDEFSLENIRTSFHSLRNKGIL